MSERLERMKERTNELLMEAIKKRGRHIATDEAVKLARDVTLEVCAEEMDRLERERQINPLRDLFERGVIGYNPATGTCYLKEKP